MTQDMTSTILTPGESFREVGVGSGINLKVMKKSTKTSTGERFRILNN